MNDSKILEEVYRDFFDSSYVSREVPAVVEEETKNEIDIDKLIDIEGEKDNIFENKVAKVDKWLELAKRLGTKCELVEE